MSKATKRRQAAAEALAAMGCQIAPVFFDRHSGSYAVSQTDGSGYFTPTFPSEAGILDWASENMGRIERHVLRGEPLEPQEFIAQIVSAAASESGDDAEALAAALAPRMDELREEADLFNDRDISNLVDALGEGRILPAEALSNLSAMLGVSLSAAPAP